MARQWDWGLGFKFRGLRVRVGSFRPKDSMPHCRRSWSLEVGVRVHSVIGIDLISFNRHAIGELNVSYPVTFDDTIDCESHYDSLTLRLLVNELTIWIQIKNTVKNIDQGSRPYAAGSPWHTDMHMQRDLWQDKHRAMPKWKLIENKEP